MFAFMFALLFSNFYYYLLLVVSSSFCILSFHGLHRHFGAMQSKIHSHTKLFWLLILILFVGILNEHAQRIRLTYCTMVRFSDHVKVDLSFPLFFLI